MDKIAFILQGQVFLAEALAYDVVQVKGQAQVMLTFNVGNAVAHSHILVLGSEEQIEQKLEQFQKELSFEVKRYLDGQINYVDITEMVLD